MKVIKQGRPQKGWSKKVRCTGDGNGGGGCGAQLLVAHPDVFRTARSCRDETDHFGTFMCCECTVLTDIDGFPHPLHELPSQLGSDRKKRQLRRQERPRYQKLYDARKKEDMEHRIAATSLGYAVLVEPSHEPGGASIVFRGEAIEDCVKHVTALRRAANPLVANAEYQVVEILARDCPS